MPFKPKAQILLQLGEQLIKSESVAILELIKNSYDADATKVTVSMQDIDNPEKGSIEILDNGKGMDLDTVQNIWMEPGNTHKKAIVKDNDRSDLGRLPIGEKGIGRFGVHKLGRKIEMITRAANCQEVRVEIDWDSFNNARYLEEVGVTIQVREPELFTGSNTGTRLFINSLSTRWTRGMLRNVYRAITSLSSPFDAIDAFRVKFQTSHKDWLDGLLTFDQIKEYALYSGHIELSGNSITEFTYNFSPFANMIGIKPREFIIHDPVKMLLPPLKRGDDPQELDLGKYAIGTIKIDLLVFDRDSAFRSKYIADKKTYGTYLDENGGIRVFRDGVRIYDYGEVGNDWLELDSRRINTPGKHLSNNLVLGAVRINRECSQDLQEKANREGFIENAAYLAFREAVKYAIDFFTAQRNIDKVNLRDFLSGGKKEPVTHDISVIRQKIATYLKDEKERKEIDGYLRRIENDYDYLQQMYLKTATAGMSYGVVIHEIEKIIAELKITVQKEKASSQVRNLAFHLSQLVESYADLLRNRSKRQTHLSAMIRQAIFSLQYRLDAHQISVETQTDTITDGPVECASNLIIGSIINIIDNSIWWTTYAGVPQRRIFIKATREINGHLAIVIADNGCGFSLAPEDAVKPFVSTKPNGMGLGLNIVNEVMLSQGGSLMFPDRGDVDLPEQYKNGAVVALVFKEV